MCHESTTPTTNTPHVFVCFSFQVLVPTLGQENRRGGPGSVPDALQGVPRAARTVLLRRHPGGVETLLEGQDPTASELCCLKSVRFDCVFKALKFSCRYTCTATT